MSIKDRFYAKLNASFKKDLRKVKRELIEQGWRIEPTAGGHGHEYAYPPEKDMQQVLIAGTPSDVRAWDNMIAELKRSGFQWPVNRVKDEPVEEESQKAEIKEPEHQFPDYAAQQEAQYADEMMDFLFDEMGGGASKSELSEVVGLINKEELERAKVG